MGLVVDIETGKPRFKDSPWHQFSGSILSGQTLVIDQLPLTQFSSMRYELSFFNVSKTETKSFSMIVQQQSGNVFDQVFGRTGLMDISVSSGVSGLNFQMSATNSEAYDVEFCLTVLTS